MAVTSSRLAAAAVLAALVQPYWSRALSKQDPAAAEAPLRAYKVETLRAFPHEGTPFTQALEISNDGHHLVESSGSYPPGTASFVRVVDPTTGKAVKQLTDGLVGRFAEGMVQMPNGHWFMSTYEDKKLVEYDKDLNFVSDRAYPLMGWGFTRSPDGKAFLTTNGTDYVTSLSADTLQVIKDQVVTCMGKRVSGLNELEMVDDFLGQGPTLLGNVYMTRLVLAVNPSNGKCTGVFNLDGLGVTELSEAQGFHVANGLAWNKTSGTLLATGKNWDQMFELKIGPDPEGTALPILERRLSRAQAAVPEKVAFMEMSSVGADGHTDHSSFLQARRLVGSDGRKLTHN